MLKNVIGSVNIKGCVVWFVVHPVIDSLAESAAQVVDRSAVQLFDRVADQPVDQNPT